MSSLIPGKPKKSDFSRWLDAAGRALLPVGGPMLDNHLDNLAALKLELPEWNRPLPTDRLFILSPHPDDETLGCGGLIQRCVSNGIPVKVAFLTNGDGSRTTQFVLNLKNPLRSDKKLFDIATNRQTEAMNAARKLGLSENDVTFLGFPDGGIRTVLRSHCDAPYTSLTTGKKRVEYEKAHRIGAAYCRESLAGVLAELLEEFAPTMVLTTPFEDTHLDHKGSFEALELALRVAKLKTQPEVISFLIHYGIWPVPNGLHPHLPLRPPAKLVDGKTQWFSLTLTPAEIEGKRAALESHTSQMASTPRYLRAFVRRNELFSVRL